MPTDIELNTDLQTDFDDRGDLRTVSGRQYAIQSVMIDVLSNTLPLRGKAVTRERLADYTDEIQTALERNEYVDGPISVDVVGRSDDTLLVDIQTGEDTLSVEIPT